jgi:hypothetical protein
VRSPAGALAELEWCDRLLARWRSSSGAAFEQSELRGEAFEQSELRGEAFEQSELRGEAFERSEFGVSAGRRPTHSQKSDAISIKLPSGSAIMADRIFQGSSRGRRPPWRPGW